MDRSDLLAAFARERGQLLPALHAVQHAERWLAPEALAAVAAHLRVPLSEIWGVATHYPEFRLREPGRVVVRVCAALACAASGGAALLAEAERRLGARVGSTSVDGITLETIDCAFACSLAPVVCIEGQVLGRVALSELASLLDAARVTHAEGGAAGVGRGASPSRGTPHRAGVARSAVRLARPGQQHALARPLRSRG